MRAPWTIGLAALLAGLTAQPAALAEHERGVTLYRDAHFQGSSQTFYDGDDIADLDRHRIGNDSVSSVRIAKGCRITLYEHEYFRGSSLTLSHDAGDLGRTYIGNDQVSSLKVDCRFPGRQGRDDRRYDDRGRDDRGDDSRGRDRYQDGYDWRGRPGVALYSDDDFGGREELVYADDPSLRDNLIRQDTVSSVRLAPGCRVILYSDVGYGGSATLLDESVSSLHGTEVGNDRVSSLELRCYRDRREGVTLYEHVGFRGRSESFVRDDPQLRGNFIRQDGVSSLRLAPGCVVTLYEHPYYRGRSTTMRRDVEDLRRTGVGNDTVSSLRIDCRRSRRHP